jgi:hypothetical protein
MVSFVSQGTGPRPGMSGTAAVEPAAMTQRRKVWRRPAASTVSGPTKWAEARITSTPMPR